MSTPTFSNFSSDYYVYRKEIECKTHSVTIYAECYRNELGVNNDYYRIDVYLSADDYSLREFMVGVSFGKEPMDQKAIDVEIENWIESITTDKHCPLSKHLKSYLECVRVLEKVRSV